MCVSTEIEITPEALAAGVEFLRSEVCSLVEAESDRFETTITELIAAMRQALPKPHAKKVAQRNGIKDQPPLS